MPPAPATTRNEPVAPDQLEAAWQQFTAQRKSQPAEFQLLSRGYRWDGHALHLELTNPIEEMLLETMRTDLLAWLRETLRNQTLQVLATVRAETEKKVAYTNREKFDTLLQKYPNLTELKDKLGLDPDF
ncbi:MAG: hypothetical protein ACK5DD_15385 [Cyclobacteriaceae bacterium]